MSKHTRNITLLEKINNIDEECLEINEQKLSEIEDDKMENDYDLYDTNDEFKSSNTDNEE